MDEPTEQKPPGEIAALPILSAHLREIRPQPDVRVLLIVLDLGAVQLTCATTEETAASLREGLDGFLGLHLDVVRGDAARSYLARG